jgi:isoleucyl-tRNA synthetase
VSKVLEPMRAAGSIGASLAAEVDLYLEADQLERLGPVQDELRFLFITSSLALHPLAARPDAAVKGEGVGAYVLARPAAEAKCVRCWHYRADVGSNVAHPELCGRCVGNVEGPAEVRRWF